MTAVAAISGHAAAISASRAARPILHNRVSGHRTYLTADIFIGFFSY
jgi:hypothetical protein